VTRVALITTTINVPYVLSDWAKSMTHEDIIVVAGDLASPHSEIKKLLEDITRLLSVTTLYIHPDEQHRWKSSDVIGWSCIQRRNIALLEALWCAPSHVLTVDDDNWPTQPDQVDHLLRVFSEPMTTLTTNTGWLDPYEFCMPKTVHRGYPLSRRHEEWDEELDEHAMGVAEMMVIGDPDIDAIERIVNRPHINAAKSVALAAGTWAPFNSQATMYRAELAPLMMVWPGVGRYDDIWASYLARRVMDSLNIGAYYGTPVVRQDRNEHDLLRDLEQEMHGMRHTDTLVQVLREIEFNESHRTTIDKLAHIYTVLNECDFVPLQTKDAFTAWLEDLDEIGVVW